MPRGFKTCKECGLLVGPRTITCKCGFQFILKRTKAFTVPRTSLIVPEPAPRNLRRPPGLPSKAVSQEPSSAAPAGVPGAIRLNDQLKIMIFIKELEKAVKDSKHSGGLYSVFLPHKHGTLHIEVGLPTQLKGKS